MSGIAVQCLEAWTGSSEELQDSSRLLLLTFGLYKRSTSGAGADFCLVVIPHPWQSDPAPQA